MEKQTGSKKSRKRILVIGVIILAVLIALPFVVSEIMVQSVKDDILLDKVTDVGADCILVLGAGLKPDGTPNHMLQDRLDMGIALYKEGVAPKLLLSGDNGQEEYDEVNSMKAYVLAAAVPEEDIFMDHAGFSTYESMYRAKAIFGVEKVIIVTQKYHQYRAIFIAESMGMKAYGAASDPRTYAGQPVREAREILARDKDFVKTIFKPEPKYLGEAIPISGNGLVTQD